MVVVNVIALILVIVGALNWGAVGFFNYNFVSLLLGGEVAGNYSVLTRAIFALVGLAGIWAISFLGRIKSICCCKHNCKHNCKNDYEK